MSSDSAECAPRITVLSAKRESHATLLLFSLPVHPRVKLMPKRTAGREGLEGEGSDGKGDGEGG